MKKLVSIILALTICLSCGAFAFAYYNEYDYGEEVVDLGITPRYKEYLECTSNIAPVWKNLSRYEDDIPPIVCFMQKGDKATPLRLVEHTGGYFWYIRVQSNGFLGYVADSDFKIVVE